MHVSPKEGKVIRRARQLCRARKSPAVWASGRHHEGRGRHLRLQGAGSLPPTAKKPTACSTTLHFEETAIRSAFCEVQAIRFK